LYYSLDKFQLQASVACDDTSTEQLQNDKTTVYFLNTDLSCSEHDKIFLEPNSTDVPGWIKAIFNFFIQFL